MCPFAGWIWSPAHPWSYYWQVATVAGMVLLLTGNHGLIMDSTSDDHQSVQWPWGHQTVRLRFWASIPDKVQLNSRLQWGDKVLTNVFLSAYISKHAIHRIFLPDIGINGSIMVKMEFVTMYTHQSFAIMVRSILFYCVKRLLLIACWCWMWPFVWWWWWALEQAGRQTTPKKALDIEKCAYLSKPSC